MSCLIDSRKRSPAEDNKLIYNKNKNTGADRASKTVLCCMHTLDKFEGIFGQHGTNKHTKAQQQQNTPKHSRKVLRPLLRWISLPRSSKANSLNCSLFCCILHKYIHTYTHTYIRTYIHTNNKAVPTPQFTHTHSKPFKLSPSHPSSLHLPESLPVPGALLPSSQRAYGSPACAGASDALAEIASKSRRLSESRLGFPACRRSRTAHVPPRLR